jgi:hypothetical protein
MNYVNLNGGGAGARKIAVAVKPHWIAADEHAKFSTEEHTEDEHV